MFALIICAAVVFFIIFRVCDLVGEDNKQKAARESQQQASDAAEEYRNSLIAQYTNSSVTREILQKISDGSGRWPEEIVITTSCVTGRTDGVIRTYDFLANRVPELTAMERFYYEEYDERDREKRNRFIDVDQRSALACAINRILNEEYDIWNGLETLKPRMEMRIKPKKSF